MASDKDHVASAPFYAYFTRISKGAEKEKRAEILELLVELREPIQNIKKKSFAKAKRARGNAVHYTSTSTLQSLLVKGGKLRLYDAASMKDPEEGEAFFDIMSSDGKKYLYEFYGENKWISQNISTFFIGSFISDNKKVSQNNDGVRDALLFWRLYGKSNNHEATGCSMAYKKNMFKGELNTEEGFVSLLHTESVSLHPPHESQKLQDGSILRPSPQEELPPLLAVFYEKREIVKELEKIKEVLDSILDFIEGEEDKENISIIKTCARASLDEIRILFKSPEYKEEREQRLVKMYPTSSESPAKMDTDKSDFPSFYVELSESFNPSKIVLGPLVDNPDAWANFIIHHDSSIEVKKSKVRYRG